MAGSSWWRIGAAALLVAVAVTFALAADRSDPGALASPAVAGGDASGPTTAPAALPASSTPDASPTKTTPTTLAPTVPTTEPAPTTTMPRQATLAFSGDIITHLAVGRLGLRYADERADEAEAQGQAGADGSDADPPAYDFTPMFAAIAPTISAADLAICHLESPLAPGARFQPFPRFNGPPELADAIAGAGFDGCSVASNHAFDQQADGVTSTLDVLEGAGLGHAGTARSAQEAAIITRYSVNDIDVAHLSATYGLNGFQLPEDEPWRVDLIDVDAILDDARQARAEGADFVVLSLHWGVEYIRLPSRLQHEQATELAASGLIDLVVGHHAHVLQPIEEIDGMLVLYGLGNFLSNQEPQCCTPYSQDGVVVTVTIGDTSAGVDVTGLAFTPTFVDRTKMEIVPVVERIAQADELEVPRWIVNNLEASLARTIASLGQLDYELPPPR